MPHGLPKEAIQKVMDAILISRILHVYASPAWWGLTKASDRLRILNLQCKSIRNENISRTEPSIESKAQKVEEKLSEKITAEEVHVLRQNLPRERYHVRSTTNFLLPPKNDTNFITSILYRLSLNNVNYAYK